MIGKHITSSFLLVGALCLGASVARAQDVVVPDDFATIQDALNGGNDVDADGTLEIFVRAGTYAENVRITSSNVELSGDAANRPTIQGNGGFDVVLAEAFTGSLSNVTVKNFVVTGGVAFDGVEYRRVNGGSVQNVESFGNTDGFRMNGVTNVTVTGCDAHDNAHTGFRLSGLVGSTLGTNVARNNGHDGIDLSGGLASTIETSDSHHNGDRGIRARRAIDMTIRTNQLHDNVSDGARFESVTRVTFTGNTCDANGENGLRTRRTIDCLVSQNALTNNVKFGVRIREDFGLDFDAATGVQGPTGDNTFAGNVSGDVRSD